MTQAARKHRHAMRGYRTVAQLLRTAPLPRGKRYLANVPGDMLIGTAREPKGVARMRDGFQMEFDLADRTQRQTYFAGVYVPALESVFVRVLRPGDIVVDGGANIGYFSLLSASCVGPRGAVHSFEPTPYAFGQLERNIALNNYVGVYPLRRALWREQTRLTLEIPRSEDGTRELDWAATIAAMGRGEHIEVETCVLDAYAAANDIKDIRLVKLDVEGAELAVLDGMSHLLSEQRVDYVLSEVNTFLLDALGLPYDGVWLRMRSYGYRGYSIGPHGELREIQAHEAGSQFAPGDYLFVRNGLRSPVA